MAKINEGSFRNWNDGEIVKASDYKQEREIIRVAVNDTHDRFLDEQANFQQLKGVVEENVPKIEAFEELATDVEQKGNYALAQGDYAKGQGNAIQEALEKSVNIIKSPTIPEGIVEGRLWADTSDNTYQGTVFEDLSDQLAHITQSTIYISDYSHLVQNGDWTIATQTALNDAQSNTTVVLGLEITVSQPLVLHGKNDIHIMGVGLAKINKSQTWIGDIATIFDVKDADNITFSGITFDGKNVAFTGNANHDWGILFRTSVNNALVTQCVFKDFPRPSGRLFAAVGFMGQTTSNRNKVINNDFINLGGGSIFVQARRTIVRNNTIKGNGDIPIALNAPTCTDCIVDGNIIEDSNLYFAIAVEDGPSRYIISNNKAINCNGLVQHLTLAYPTVVYGGEIFGNTLNGTPDLVYTGSTSPVGIILNQYYVDVNIYNNRIEGIRNKSATRACIFLQSAKRVNIYDNTFDGSFESGISGIVTTGTCENVLIRRNKFIRFSRGIWFNSTSTKLVVKENTFFDFIAGTEGITGVVGTYEDNEFHNFLGTRYVGFPWEFNITNNSQHLLTTDEGRSVIYRSQAPTTGTWRDGDIVINNNPNSNGTIASWVRTNGTWRPSQTGTVGNISGAPSFVGQFAILGGIAYIATGTTSSADWKQITA